MSIYRCSGCQSYRDADQHGINATETGELLEYCDRCWESFDDPSILLKEQNRINDKTKKQKLVKGDY